MNTIKRLWQQVTSRPPEYPTEVSKLILQIVHLSRDEDTIVRYTAYTLLQQWDHDRNAK